jgi:hypothetical protein
LSGATFVCILVALLLAPIPDNPEVCGSTAKVFIYQTAYGIEENGAAGKRVLTKCLPSRSIYSIFAFVPWPLALSAA